MYIYPEMKIDNLDLEIIKHLQDDARLSFRELGRKLSIPHTTVFTRAERLVKRGVIKNFSAVLHPHDLGLQHGFVFVNSPPSKSKDVASSLSGFDEVRKVFRTFDGKVIAKVVIPGDGHQSWENFLTKLNGFEMDVFPIHDVVKFESSIPGQTLKSLEYYVDK